MKTNRRKKRKKSKIRTIAAPRGVSAEQLVRALKKDKFFARLDANGRIVTNAPIK